MRDAEALATLTNLTRSNGKNSALRVLRAYVLLELGNATGALDDAKVAESSGVHTAYKCWFLAQVAYLTGDKTAVSVERIKHIGADPTYGTGAEKLGRALDRRAQSEASVQQDTLVERMPKARKIINISGSALVVLIGAAGSGKSTFARTLTFWQLEILSSDRYRGMVSDNEADQEATDDAFAVLHSVLEKRMRRGKLCLVDATNVRSEHRATLIHCARLYKRPTLAIVFETPEEMCVERAGNRAGRSVKAAVIQAQAKNMAPQTDDDLLREGFRKVFRLTPTDEVEIRRTLPVSGSK